MLGNPHPFGLRVFGLRQRHRRHVAGFHAVVEFVAEAGREVVGKLLHAEFLTPRRRALELRGQPECDVEVPFDQMHDPRSLHLDGHRFPGDQRRPVHLPDRGCGQGDFVERGEHRLDGLAELGFEQTANVGPLRRRHPLLKQGELREELLREQIGAGGENLTEFHERSTGILERPAQRSRLLGAFSGAGDRRIGVQPKWNESVPQGDPGDLGVAAGAGKTCLERRQPEVGSGNRAGRHDEFGDDEERDSDEENDADLQWKQGRGVLRHAPDELRLKPQFGAESEDSGKK